MPTQGRSLAAALAAQLRPERRDVFGLLGYTPSPKQQEFHDATEFDVLYGGAAGGGKSQAIVMEALRVADWYAGISVRIARRSYPELEESIMPKLYKVKMAAALGAKWNQQQHELRFPNGSNIRLLHVENLVDASRVQGGEFQLLLVDELTLMPPGAVDQLKERLRTVPSAGVPLLGVRSTSNPGGASHGDVKRRYIDATGYGAQTYADASGETVRFISAKVSDNPHVDPGYRLRLAAIPDEARRKAMLDGDWDSFSGQVFTEWSRERHVVMTYQLPVEWERYLGVDWGYTAPWAAIWGAVDEDGRLWLYRELYDTQVGEHDQARRILAAEDAGEAPTRVGDPAMWASRGDAEAISSAYQAEGVHLRPGNNGRLAGWQRIHDYLADGPACPHHRKHGWTTCPLLHIFPNCANLIRTLPTLPYSMTKPEDVDTKAEDHAADALRYLCMEIGAAPEFPVFDEPVQTDLEGKPLAEEMGMFAYPQQQRDNLGPFVRRGQ